MFTAGCKPLTPNAWVQVASPKAVAVHVSVPAVSAVAASATVTTPLGGSMRSLLELAAAWIIPPLTAGVVQLIVWGGFRAVSDSAPPTRTPDGMRTWIQPIFSRFVLLFATVSVYAVAVFPLAVVGDIVAVKRPVADTGRPVKANTMATVNQTTRDRHTTAPSRELLERHDLRIITPLGPADGRL